MKDNHVQPEDMHRRGGARPRRARARWRVWPRRAGVPAAVAGLALLMAACGGGASAGSGGSSSAGTSAAYAKAVAFAKCMRSHGIPNFPDPNSKGQFIQQNGGSSNSGHVSDAALQAANSACRHLAPPGGPGSLTPQQRQQMVSQSLKFTKCMRAHGVPNMPDPGANGQITLPKGMNGKSPQVQSAQRACQSLITPPGQGAP